MPHNSGAQCDDARDAVEKYASISEWQCVDDGEHGGVQDTTRLWFESGFDMGRKISRGLEEAYPEVGELHPFLGRWRGWLESGYACS